MADPKDKRRPLPPLSDADIREALRLQSATIRAVTEVLRAKGILDQRDLIEIRKLRDALVGEVRKHEEAGPKILPPDRTH